MSAGLRLLASLLFLVWTIPAATADQVGHDVAKEQMRLAASKPVATILVRDIARRVAAETFRFKTGTPAIAGNGKPFCIMPDLRLPFETASAAPIGIGSEDRTKLSPIRAFDARAPPFLPP
ncbi:hypothetical protein EOA85_07270 [Mesorhizobium sp. M5C.F.Ca.IN.020.29.1.1]|uniref:hypothetical protein n=1 Tax=unclassified Mesorhizobium TaxID=325217 RepID=UPI000FCC20A2|nr:MULTISPECIES: hypothetical protein [unclassified Mesorhizobium]RUV61548.1 hypothetical protein EOA85_07270 [Mesorhizobium sp. M5C.F.Ca.IN.020.29.1.1]TIM90186.1 MAG: hypothetical protein E5Y50_03000 [Mesorhizobium sp.]